MAAKSAPRSDLLNHVVVIGGGAAGTAAVSRLMSLGYKVTILERNSQLGGRIQSRGTAGVNYELGACFLTPRLYKQTFDILDRLDLRGDLHRRTSQAGQAVVIKDGVKMTSHSLIGSQWLSYGAKRELIKIAAFVALHKHKLNIQHMWRAEKYDDLSAAEMFSKKYRDEIVEYLIAPIINGYFYWQPETTSRAIILLLMASLDKAGRTYTMNHGLQQIPNKLADGATIMTGCEVVSVRRSDNLTYEISYQNNVGAQHSIIAAGVVVATTASMVPKIVSNLSAVQRKFFENINYSACAVVVRSYKVDNLSPSRAVAFPRREKAAVSTVTVDSSLNAAGECIEIIKSFASAGNNPEIMSASDDVVTAELAVPTAAGLVEHGEAQSIDTEVHRWAEALPVYDVGHLQRIKQFHDGEIEKAGDRLVFAGDYIGGPYIEGAITSGYEAADRLATKLN